MPSSAEIAPAEGRDQPSLEVFQMREALDEARRALVSSEATIATLRGVIVRLEDALGLD